MPTEQGSRIYKGSRPGVDAAVVGLLRAAGASILGKTVRPSYSAEIEMMDCRADMIPDDLRILGWGFT
jgi:hypothetical protein